MKQLVVSIIQSGFFSKKLENGFETDLFLLYGLKPNPALPKAHFWDARTVSKFDWPSESLSTSLQGSGLSFQVIHNFYKS